LIKKAKGIFPLLKTRLNLKVYHYSYTLTSTVFGPIVKKLVKIDIKISVKDV